MVKRRTPVVRPRQVPYQWKALLDLPARILNPPPAPCKIRSLKISPDFKVELDDILDNKHLPPMALKDFEEYLLFTEYTVENLYFVMWFRDYSKSYESYALYLKAYAGMENKTKPMTSGDLALRFSRALSTFFDANSELALNLPYSLSNSIVGLSGKDSHPPPEAFTEVHDHVKDLLKASLNRFVKRSYGNSDKNRAWFGLMCGMAQVLVGLGIVFGSIFGGWPRAARIAAYLPFLTGTILMFSSTNGLCPIIFSFAGADARQLHTYELVAPKIPSAVGTAEAKEKEKTGAHHIPPFALSAAMNTVDSADRFSSADAEERKLGTRADSSSLYDAKDIELDTSSLGDSVSEFLYTASFIPRGTPSFDGTTLKDSEGGSTYKFDFDALPSKLPSRRSRSDSVGAPSSSGAGTSIFSGSSPTFGSLTRVLNPIVVRSQWEIAVRSMTAGFVVSTVLMAGLLAVPFYHGRHHG